MNSDKYWRILLHAGNVMRHLKMRALKRKPIAASGHLRKGL